MSRVSGAAARRREPEVFGGRRVAAFGETLVVGLAVTALALPLVTAAPALAAELALGAALTLAWSWRRYHR